MAIYMWRLIPVTWITLDKNSINLSTVWQTEQLTATVLPDEASDKTVNWTSSNTSIATVNSSWLVTCVTPWECTITATTNDGWYTATCSVKSATILDFTTQNVLTFKYRQNSYTWYGWTSWSWYWTSVQNSSYYRTNSIWAMPDSVFSWTLDVIKLELYVPNLYSWGGINTWYGGNSSWMWLWGWDTNSTNQMSFFGSYSAYNYSTWWQTLVVDLANAKIWVEWGATPLNISSTYVNNIRNAWNSKSLYLNIVANQAYVTTNLRKVEIQTS